MRFFAWRGRGRTLLIAAATAVCAVCCAGCGGNKDASPPEKSGQASASKTADTFTDDRDGQKYRTVKIGNQVWMAENLRFKTAQSKCYDGAEANCVKYGRLYDWDAASAACPNGWHLPTRKEWAALIAYVGSETAGKKLRASSGWEANGSGTDDYGFSALPGSTEDSDGDPFSIGYGGYWWTATENGGMAYYLIMYTGDDGVEENFIEKGNGYSVRCLADYAEPPTGEQKEYVATDAKLIERIPVGYRLYSEEGKDWIMRGDLNGDGADDYVLIIKATDKKMFVRRDEDDPNSELLDRNSRGVMIFFKDGDDYNLAVENRQCFSSENEDGGVYFAPMLSVEIKNGNLYVNYDHGRYGWWKYTLRYRNSEFELIGYDDEDFYSGKGTSINIPAKKQLLKVCLNERGEDDCADCCAGYKKTWKNNITFKEPILLRKIDYFDGLRIDDYIIEK